MENVAYRQKNDINDSYQLSELLNTMNNVGFDFALTGTKYLYELFELTPNNSYDLYKILIPNMSNLADRHNIKLKSLNRDIRWSLDKKIDINYIN